MSAGIGARLGSTLRCYASTTYVADLKLSGSRRSAKLRRHDCLDSVMGSLVFSCATDSIPAVKRTVSSCLAQVPIPLGEFRRTEGAVRRLHIVSTDRLWTTIPATPSLP